MKTTHTRKKLGGTERYNGLGMSPRPTVQHQYLVRNISFNILNILKASTLNKYDVLQEVELSGPNTLAPDIVVFNKKSKKPHFIIEIENQKGTPGTIKKIQNKLLPNYPTVKEIYVYNYTTKEFIQVTHKETMVVQASAFLNKAHLHSLTEL